MKNFLFSLLLLLTIASLNAQDKREGHYWDKNGVKRTGELKPVFGTIMYGTRIKFYQNDEKEGKWGKDVMESFVWGTDSFALIHHFQVASVGSYSSDFAKVLEVGEIVLYKHFRKVRQSAGMPGQMNIPIAYTEYTYVVKAKGEDKYYGIFSKNQFKKYFLPLILKDMELTEKVLEMKKREWLDHIPQFVREFNAKY